MRRTKGEVLFCALVAVIVAVLATPAAWAQQSTTGPVPPPGIDRGIRPITAAQVTIPGVPAYIWHHGCGPTAMGMVVGYWDGHGFSCLVPGDASTQTAAVNAMIADDRANPNCAAADGDHYQDYSCPLDYSPGPLLTDRSETGGAHASNCVGDFFETSWSSRSNYYGWSWFSDAPPSFTGYVNWVEPQYSPSAENLYFNQFSWASYKAEIDAGRPVVMLVDTDGNDTTDHFVTGIGYDNSNNTYGVYDTWDRNTHWYLWRGKGLGNTWGIYGVTLFRAGPPLAVILIDRTGSMGTRRRNMNTRLQDAKSYAKQDVQNNIEDGTRIAVMYFDSNGIVVQLAFTDNKPDVLNAIDAVPGPGAATPLADAMCEAAELLRSTGGWTKSLYTYTDGYENASDGSQANLCDPCDDYAGGAWNHDCDPEDDNPPCTDWQDCLVSCLIGEEIYTFRYFGTPIDKSRSDMYLAEYGGEVPGDKVVPTSEDLAFLQYLADQTGGEMHVVPDEEVPTLTQWGVIILSGLLTIALIFMIKRKKARVPLHA